MVITDSSYDHSISLLLFVFVWVSVSFEYLSAEMCSLLFSFLEFVLTILNFMGGYAMEVSVLVVIGFNGGRQVTRWVGCKQIYANRA